MIWKIIAVITDVIDEMKKDNLGAFAAQTTYFMILSAIPFLILFITVLQYTAVSEDQLIHMIELSIPEYLSPFIVGIVKEMYNNSVGVLSVAVIGAVWSSAKGVQYLSAGLNAIYNIEENRNWFILRFRAIGYTLVFSLTIILSILLLVLGNVFRRRLLSEFPIVGYLVQTVMNLRYLIVFAILFVLFLFVLWFLPNRKASFKSQVPAAFVAAMAWIAMSVGISIYIDFFDGFSMYGSMTTMMLLLMYVYFGIYILFLCAELNSMYENAMRMWWRSVKKRWKGKKKDKKNSI